jgi:hypothetical protein
MSPFVFFFITSVIAAFAFADESPISEQNKGW